MRKLLLLFACVVVAPALTVLAPTSALAVEEETHFFDATLSLTGDCSTATVDPVPDPGTCPMPPGVPGVDHPKAGFRLPKGVAVDAYGNRYVSSFGPESANPNESRIDVFDSTGQFITELAEPKGFRSIAVDSEGNLYVVTFVQGGSSHLYRYSPSLYEPQASEIEYGKPPVEVEVAKGEMFPNQNTGLAINSLNDHLFFYSCHFEEYEWEELPQTRCPGSVAEYSSAIEGNELIDSTIAQGKLETSTALAVDGTNQRVYIDTHRHIGDISSGESENLVQVYDLNAPHDLLATLDGSATPAGKFLAGGGTLALAVEEATGHLFVGDLGSAKKVYELELDGSDESYVSTIQPSSGNFASFANWPQMIVDNSPTSPKRGYLYVPSGEGSPGRSFAFKPLSAVAKPPVVEAVSFGEVTEDEALLRATINPEGLEADYRFEYTTQSRFEEEEGFAGATVAGDGSLAPSAEGQPVGVHVTGLAPGTAYRFRVVAESEAGEEEGQSTFTTYRAPDASEGCPNEVLRTGASTGLPDCRAYELVTPPDTNGHSPIGGSSPNLSYFGSFIASPGGDKLSYTIEGGPLPGFEGTGFVAGDPYLATRSGGGWVTSAAGPAGTESTAPLFGGIAPAQDYSFWTAQGTGSALLEGKITSLVRFPDGHSEPIGQGSLGVQREVTGRLITDDGAHMVFDSGVGGGSVSIQLEPNAPPSGTRAIYDRTAGGVTHVVSLKPENATPVANEGAFLRGASADGSAVAFVLADPSSGVNQETGKSPLYLRVDNAETLIAAPAGADFAGLSADGRYLSYLLGESLYRFDSQSKATVPFAESDDVTVVNLSADGSTAYFVSPTALPEQESPLGEVPQAGEENLYLSREGTFAFLGTVTGEDVKSLGLWTNLAAREVLSRDPSRTTPDGSVFLFESRADLTETGAGGHVHVYRYHAEAPTLECLSCNPTQAPASGDARLAPIRADQSNSEPLADLVLVRNLREDGARAFFQTTEPLVLADTNGSLDVYEWEEEGVGSCQTEGGCTYLISSGRSPEPSYLFAVSKSGDDVFISTTDLLTADDPDETRSVYDVRVNGGFAPKSSGPAECLGEACQPTVVAPNDPTPASSSYIGAGNLKKSPTSSCPKGKKVRRVGGKTRCVAKHHKKRHHKKAKRRAKGTGGAGR